MEQENKQNLSTGPVGKWLFIIQECIAFFSLNENIWKIKLTFLLKISSAIQILPEPSDVSKDTIHKH